ncbi:MAG: hypothetical protein HOV81_20535 [Kofleriaceae bacterium]|nr:hypothetical protein [Kofleriaceae bacterium]
MLQHARRGKQHVAPDRSDDIRRRAAPATAGKRTLTEALSVAHSDPYKSTVTAARRDIEAVRALALPAYRAALRDKSLAPFDKDREVARTAILLRHALMTANQHVRTLEKAMTFPDPMVTYLRDALDAVIGRAEKLGAYKGFEDQVPQPHVEDPSLEYRAQEYGRFGKTAHAHGAAATAPTTSAASIVRPRVPAEPPRIRMPRGTSLPTPQGSAR